MPDQLRAHAWVSATDSTFGPFLVGGRLTDITGAV